MYFLLNQLSDALGDTVDDCPGPGITWYAPPGVTCLNGTNTKKLNSSSIEPPPSTSPVVTCKEQEAWQHNIHAIAFVSSLMVWLCLFTASVIVVRGGGAETATCCSTEKKRKKMCTLFLVMAICMAIASVLLGASSQLLDFSTQSECLTLKKRLNLHWSHLFLTLTACILGCYGSVGVTSMWIFRFSSATSLKSPMNGLEEGEKHDNENSDGGPPTPPCCCCYGCCCRFVSFCQYVVALAVGYYTAYDSWFGFEKGHFYLLFMLIMEVVEIGNQAYQLIEFGDERDVAWVIGVSTTMMCGGCLLPIPELINRQGPEHKFTSKVVAALTDLLLDTVYLSLALIVHQNSLLPFTTDSWWIAVFAFVFPALGAFKTLNEVAQQVCLVDDIEESTTADEFKPSERCIARANLIAIALTLLAMLLSIGCATSFIVNASVGYGMCEDELGGILFHGSFPKIVLKPGGSSFCNLTQIIKIDAATTAAVDGRDYDPQQDPLQLQMLPSVLSKMNLKSLDVRGHNISIMPVELLQATSTLEDFLIDGNPIESHLDFSTLDNITSFPIKIAWFFKHTLKELNLSNTELACYPKDVAQLSNLISLDLTKTNISFVPPYVFLPEFRNSNYFDSGPSNYPNITVLLNNTPVSKTLDWSNQFRNFQREVIIKMSFIFPDLETINLAGNDIVNATFPPLFLFPKLQNVDVSRNLIASAPWVHLDMLEELDVLNMEFNRLQNVAVTMTGGVEFTRSDFEGNMTLHGGEKEGFTCGMLERLRKLSSFSIGHNFIHTAIFSPTEDEDPRERWYFDHCPQGPIAVMQGTVAAATFLLPHVSAFSWSLKYCPYTEKSANLLFKSWEDAELQCQSLGTDCHLASIHSSEEAEFIATMAQRVYGYKQKLWFGLNDRAIDGEYVSLRENI